MNQETRTKGFNIKEKMIKFYNIEEKMRGTFFLQTDWLLENAVFPLENGYVENLIDLWNVYMPNYKFDRIILEYSNKYYPVLRYLHDGEIFRFDSVKYMEKTVIKNFLKYRISQGETNRITLVKDIFDILKDISDRARLYNTINYTIENYFQNNEIEQHNVTFLKKFQDYTEQPYVGILERLTDIHEQKEEALNARSNLYNSLGVKDYIEESFQTLINILLCRLAITDGEQRFSDVLEKVWNNTMSNIPYSDKVYIFIEKYEKPYMNAACFGIKNIGDGKIINQLYKDAVILCTVVESIEKGCKYGIREVNDFWKRDGMKFPNSYFFNDEYERMKAGFNADILISNKADIDIFHKMLLERIDAANFSFRISSENMMKRKNTSSEMNHAVLNEKDRQIEELQEKISELEESIDNTENEVLSKFISLLDSKKYNHVLGKLYRLAYTEDKLKMEDIQITLKNLFEIMNISGIDIYGKINSKVSVEEVKRGKYRVDNIISKDAVVKYPGYKIGNSVILHPLAEEV